MAQAALRDHAVPLSRIPPNPKDIDIMDAWLKTMIWEQFGASIDMLDDVLEACPDRLWTATLWDDPDEPKFGKFWSVASHTVLWLDLYLTGPTDPAAYTPPPPFIRGFPDEPYSKKDVRAYLEASRRKCREAIEGLTDERAQQVCTWGSPYLRLQLMSMRHVQEHASQLGLQLGQNGVSGPDWIPSARD